MSTQTAPRTGTPATPQTPAPPAARTGEPRGLGRAADPTTGLPVQAMRGREWLVVVAAGALTFLAALAFVYFMPRPAPSARVVHGATE